MEVTHTHAGVERLQDRRVDSTNCGVGSIRRSLSTRRSCLLETAAHNGFAAVLTGGSGAKNGVQSIARPSLGLELTNLELKQMNTHDETVIMREVGENGTDLSSTPGATMERLGSGTGDRGHETLLLPVS